MNLVKLIALSSIVSTQLLAASIFGNDDRKEWYEITDNKLRDISLSTAVRVPKSHIVMLDGKYDKYFAISGKYRNSTYGRSYKMCSDEKFFKQIDVGSCTGFLIDEETLVTAGHCVKTQSDCDKVAWVFDYKMKNKDTDLRWGLKSNVFTCRKIVKSKLSKKLLGLGRSNLKVDFSIIKLDRKTGREGFKLSRKRARIGQNLTIIGYPSGLPLKIAGNGKVLSKKKKTFNASIDAFAGNSGSPVIDSDSLEVVGILIGGKNDFVKGYQEIPLAGYSRPFLKKCNRAKVYSTNYRNSGEIVSNISNLLR